MNMLVNLNGKLLNEKNALVSVNNRSFRYGDGCFETIKLVNGKISLPEFHLDRLFASLRLLQFEAPSFFTPPFIIQSISDLVERNKHQQLARVRLTIFRGNGGLYDPENHHPNYLIQSWPLKPENNNLNENGLVLGTYPNGFKAADAFANIKSNNFLLYAMAALYSKQQHWNDALVLNHRETFADATIANLFIISNKTIITPPLSDGPVNGTMRRYLLQQLPVLGYTVKEQSISSELLNEADECFLTNAIYGMKWVKQHGDTSFQSKHVFTIHKELIKSLW
ncbi:MAG: aminotransferase class IV [Bacteroidota bacterium]